MYLNYFTLEEDLPIFVQYGYHNEPMFLHTHADFSELVLVLDGSATHIVNGERYHIEKGDVFVISDDIAHSYADPVDFKLCNVMFQPDKIFSYDYDIQKSYGFHALFVLEPHLIKDHKFQSRFKLSLPDYQLLNDKISFMVDTIASKDLGWKTILLTEFLQMVVVLSKAYTLPNKNDRDSLLNLACPVAYMENHYTESLSISQLSALSGLSERHFTRLFQVTYHTTPLQYLLRLRIQHACLLLSNPRLPISEIAYSCGFEDSNYFSRQFKKAIGVSPKAYRSQIASHTPVNIKRRK